MVTFSHKKTKKKKTNGNISNIKNINNNNDILSVAHRRKFPNSKLATLKRLSIYITTFHVVD